MSNQKNTLDIPFPVAALISGAVGVLMYSKAGLTISVLSFFAVLGIVGFSAFFWEFLVATYHRLMGHENLVETFMDLMGDYIEGLDGGKPDMTEFMEFVKSEGYSVEMEEGGGYLFAGKVSVKMSF